LRLERRKNQKKNGRLRRKEDEDTMPPWISDQWEYSEEAN
jgi:hypothetical protein